MAFNAKRMLNELKHVVELACGYNCYTGAMDRCVCPRCTEMLKRSLLGLGEDYEGFRHGGRRDMMAWPDDPCRQFNEPIDLDVNFIRDAGINPSPSTTSPPPKPE